MSRSVLLQWSAHEFAPGPYAERNDTQSNRLDRWIGAGLGRLSRLTSPVRIQGLRRFAREVEAHAAELASLPDEKLAALVEELRSSIPREGLTRALSARIFALVREVSARTLGLRHYLVQVMAGYAMLRGALTEMQTGEGKTLSATLPAIAVALAHIPVHIVTVNDYLARRDAEYLQALYGFFGLSVGFLAPGQTPEERRQMYNCDITYCVNKDLVFDYLRDRLGGRIASSRAAINSLFDDRSRARLTTLRGLYFAIIDEADSVLIDEARTPLIISADTGDAVASDDYSAALRIASTLRPEDMVVSPAEHFVHLTAEGQARAEAQSLGLEGLWRFRKAREELIEQALAATRLYERDKHYLVADGKIQIVDEFTGRTMEDRSWERGLHQLIELKEGVELTQRRETIARVTYQRFFRRYLWLAGMSGTVAEVAPELRAIFALDAVRIPTHRPLRRRNFGERVFVSAHARWLAVVDRVREMRAAGRAVLIGTRSVEASERLSALLDAEGIEHTLLNARQDKEEASIIAKAGQRGRVTVATNMAGRGTDIVLEPPVREAGGLHVILTEFHESRRIDRQLFGRAGRQGDPGSYESIVSLEDELFATFGGRWTQYAAKHSAARDVVPSMLASLLRRRAQHAAERLHARIRRRTLEADKQISRSLAFSGRGE